MKPKKNKVMTKGWLLSFTFVFLITSLSHATNPQETMTMIFDSEKSFRQAVAKDMQKFQATLTGIISTPELKQRCIQRARRDLEIATALNVYLEPFQAEDYPDFDKGQITWPLKQNMYVNVLNLVIPLLESRFDDLISGVLTDVYAKELSYVTILGMGDGNKINGNSRATALKAALLTISQEAAKGPFPDVDTSVLFHTTPLPQDFKGAHVHPEFEQYSYFYQDAKSPPQGELVFAHSGYAFGGMRGERRHRNKVHGPEDCSTWVRKALNIPVDFSTYHQMFLHNKAFGKGYVDPEWIVSQDALILSEHLIPVEVSTMGDIKPGYIYTERWFKEGEDPMTIPSQGIRGHLGFVTEVKSQEGKVEVLSYKRDMPDQEGFGLMDFDVMNVPEKKRVFFFKTQ